MFLYTVFLVMSRVLADEGYCSLGYRRLCQGKGMHVACQFPVVGPGPFCQNYTRVEMTSSLQNFITDYINRRRQRLAAGRVEVRDGQRVPQPQTMMLVSWDRELAYLAQRLADQCQFLHDECRATVRYPYAGQSVGEVRLRRPHPDVGRLISRVMDAWWSERRLVAVDQLTAPFRPVKGLSWGHFSQLSIWNLRSVGCGAVTHGAATLLLVCDFSHTNMLGQTTLRAGPIGYCPEGSRRIRNSEFPLLCAPITSNGNNLKEDRNDIQERTGKTLEYSRVTEDDDDHVEVTKKRFESLTLTRVRPKWRRTRTKWIQGARTKKPGISVMLKNRPIIISRARRPSVTLHLDKEDLEQIYRDTGFRADCYEKIPSSLNK